MSVLDIIMLINCTIVISWWAVYIIAVDIIFDATGVDCTHPGTSKCSYIMSCVRINLYKITLFNAVILLVIILLVPSNYTP